MRPSLVNFVVVGVQKAGTTALFDYLQDDPAYGLPDVKEVHFFDDETIDWSAPDYGPYHARFDWSDPTLIRGEATPIYIYWPRSLERLAAYNPAAKIILMLRDPVERAWSHWRMETSRGVEVYLAVTGLYFVSAFAINRIALVIETRTRVPGMIGAK